VLLVHELFSFTLSFDGHAANLALQVDLRSRRHLDISEVGRRSGLAPSTLRFYEEKGLIASSGRRGLRRLFPIEVLERLALIALGRAAGFSLEEIAGMFAPDGRPRIDRKMLSAKAEDLDETIRKLSSLRDGLRHAAACPARTHLECPTFRRYLRAATLGEIRARRAPTRAVKKAPRRG
jgi:DNA-binding transcriptional MerR regulator